MLLLGSELTKNGNVYVLLVFSDYAGHLYQVIAEACNVKPQTFSALTKLQLHAAADMDGCYSLCTLVGVLCIVFGQPSQGRKCKFLQNFRTIEFT